MAGRGAFPRGPDLCLHWARQEHTFWLLANFASPASPAQILLPHLGLTGMRDLQSELESHTIVLLQPLTDRRSRTFLDFETVGKAVDGGIPHLQDCNNFHVCGKINAILQDCVACSRSDSRS